MRLVLVVIALGMAAGQLAGGRLERIPRAGVRWPGFALVLLGLALNLAVIGANGGMPVSRRAIVASGQQDTLAALLRDGDGVKHHLAGPRTRLLPLADVLAVPQPVGQVIS